MGSPSYSQAFCQKIGVTRVVGFSQEEARLHRTPQGTSDRATFPGARKYPFTLSQTVTQRVAGDRRSQAAWGETQLQGY